MGKIENLFLLYINILFYMWCPMSQVSYFLQVATFSFPFQVAVIWEMNFFSSIVLRKWVKRMWRIKDTTTKTILKSFDMLMSGTNDFIIHNINPLLDGYIYDHQQTMQYHNLSIYSCFKIYSLLCAEWVVQVKIWI